MGKMRGGIVLATATAFSLLATSCGSLQEVLLPPGAGEERPCPRLEAPLVPLTNSAGRAPEVLPGGIRTEGGDFLPFRRGVFRLLGEPNDPLYPSQRAFFQAVAFPWDEVRASPSCVPLVAVVDSAFNLLHPELKGRVRDRWNFVDESPNVGMDEAVEGIGHGMGVAGAIGALTDNGQGIASHGAGVPRLLLYRVFAKGRSGALEATPENVARAILRAVDQGANVISLSLGATEDLGIKPVIDYALGKGVVVVAAAGNDGGGLHYPARYPGVLAVGSTDLSGNLLPYSSRSHSADPRFFGAPGGSRGEPFVGLDYGALGISRYGRWTGTSFAAPQVAALTALMEAYAYTHRGTPMEGGEFLRCLGRGASGNGRMVNFGEALLCAKGVNP
jgi:serine protease